MEFLKAKNYLKEEFKNDKNKVVEDYIEFYLGEVEHVIISATMFNGTDHYYFCVDNQLLYTEDELFDNIIINDEVYLFYVNNECEL